MDLHNEVALIAAQLIDWLAHQGRDLFSCVSQFSGTKEVDSRTKCLDRGGLFCEGRIIVHVTAKLSRQALKDVQDAALLIDSQVA